MEEGKRKEVTIPFSFLIPTLLPCSRLAAVYQKVQLLYGEGYSGGAARIPFLV